MYYCRRYQTRTSHLYCATLHYRLCLVWFYRIFPRYIINCTVFEKNLFDIKYIFIFCATLALNVDNF